jgi:hypothetical protein
MLRNLFGPTKSILCPYCLASIHFKEGDKIDRCPTGFGKDGCGADLPPKYVAKFNQMQPCYTQLIGWSQVGKTVYLQALTAMLMSLGAMWKDDYAPSAQTEATLRYNRNVRSYMSSGEMPPITQLQLQEAYIMQLEKMVRWGGRTLVLRDVAGEHFNELKFPIEQTPYLIHVPTTLMMISVNDLSNHNFTMDQLMGSYIHTLMKYDSKYGSIKRNVIVVLTKADLLSRILPSTLQSYLVTDPFTNALVNANEAQEMGDKDMSNYMRDLHHVSDEIQEWVKSIDGGRTLIALAKNEDIELRFSLISSTGGSVSDDKRMNISIAPTRVLDPFFWALEYQSRE